MENSNVNGAIPGGRQSDSECTTLQPHSQDMQQPAVAQEDNSSGAENSAAPAAQSKSWDRYSTWRTCLGSTLTGNALVMPSILLSLTGLVWMILSQRWTMRNDQLQDCISLRVCSYLEVEKLADSNSTCSRFISRQRLAT